MMEQVALAALWLGAGLGVATFILTLVGLRKPGERSAIKALTLVAAGLCFPALVVAPSGFAIGIGAWLLVAGLAIAVVATSRLHRDNSKHAARLLAATMVAAVVLLFARAQAAGVDTELSLADRLEVAATHCGLAALAVAAILFVTKGRRPKRRFRFALQPWLLASWLLLTLALLLGSLQGSGLAPAPVLAGWVIVSVASLALWLRDGTAWSLQSLQSWGAAIALVGVAFALAGLVASFALAESRRVTVREGERTEIGPWLIQLNNITPAAGPGWVALEAEIEASRGAGAERLEPQQRYALGHSRARGVASSRALWIGELRASLDAGGRVGAWPVRLSWRPFTGVIWAGLGLALFGGLLVALARGWRMWRRRPDPDWRRRSYA